MKRTISNLLVFPVVIVVASIAYGSFSNSTFQYSLPILPDFSGSSENYTLHHGSLGLGGGEGNSTNYQLEFTMPNQPTGTYHSSNYKLYLGPYYLHYFGLPEPFPWDVTGDGYVGIDDIVAVAEHFGQSPSHPSWDSKYDITGDDYVGIDDIVSVAEHFGESL